MCKQHQSSLPCPERCLQDSALSVNTVRGGREDDQEHPVSDLWSVSKQDVFFDTVLVFWMKMKGATNYHHNSLNCDVLIDATWLNDSSLKWVHITVWTDEHFNVGAIVYLKKHGERLCLKDWAEERCFPQDTEICPVTYLYKISKVSGHVWTRFTLDWYNVGKCFIWGRAAFQRWLFSHVYSCWENVQKSSECPRWRKLCAAFKKMIKEDDFILQWSQDCRCFTQEIDCGQKRCVWWDLLLFF